MLDAINRRNYINIYKCKTKYIYQVGRQVGRGWVSIKLKGKYMKYNEKLLRTCWGTSWELRKHIGNSLETTWE